MPGGRSWSGPPRALPGAIAAGPLLVCHTPSVQGRIRRSLGSTYDLLELFAFVHPARSCHPTPRGLCRALALAAPEDAAAQAASLPQVAARLLGDLEAGRADRSTDPLGLAWTMGKAGWTWAPAVLAALGQPGGPADGGVAALRVWAHMPEWTGSAPPPPPRDLPVSADEAQANLAALLAGGAVARRPREEQVAYAGGVAPAFQPRNDPEAPVFVEAEAGTGVGKTLGYLAPALAWAERNGAAVWVSTYTRNLQHQVVGEIDRLGAFASGRAGSEPARSDTARENRPRVVIRKGRENYLCLLNFEEATRTLPIDPQHGAALGLMARWVAATSDGDLSGGDFPGWMVDLLGPARTLGHADRRGECIYSACTHYQRCFIERSIRRARKADIVVANHALVMIQAAIGGEERALPTRYVFDEGHHLFDAADDAFAGHLTGREMAELRRWLIGAESGRRSGRMRGLRRRTEDLLAGGPEGEEALQAVERAAGALPGERWGQRVIDGRPLPGSAAEAFLALVYRQVRARAAGVDGPHDLEIDPGPPVDGLVEAAAALDRDLGALQRPLGQLAAFLRRRLTDEAEDLDTGLRQRLEALARGLERRARMDLGAWRQMLADLAGDPRDGVVDWFGIAREPVGDRTRDADVGYYRHFVDPTRAFVAALATHAHGVVVTSATLTDGTGDAAADWAGADQRTGAVHLPAPPLRVQVSSPFDYPAHTRVFVVRDVRKDDLDQVAAAYRALFVAAGGGALGLFTAISRLRAVHGRIAPELDAAGLPLLAQHVDAMGVASLIDIFRAEPDSCLIGTDAVRDGVDVPGRSLRLIVFDRVPWPRPSILHRARREAFGGRTYDDLVVRLRLKQAFGRLIRQADDTGVFVLLDPMMPSRLLGAFPAGVEVVRCGLAEAVAETRAFLSRQGEG
ncbi:MAG: ATP-dependent DNA helicase [Rhodospirillaceae bacterium]|nr:ATP-dependent DNA helicase [Rhodospirillaceae bacterium]